MLVLVFLFWAGHDFQNFKLDLKLGLSLLGTIIDRRSDIFVPERWQE